MQGETQEVLARPGTVEIRLSESPTTGYEWSVVDTPHPLQRLGDTFLPEASPGMVGGGGVHVFRFHADAPGEYPVTFELKRVWEPEAIEVRTIRIVISDPTIKE